VLKIIAFSFIHFIQECWR